MCKKYGAKLTHKQSEYYKNRLHPLGRLHLYPKDNAHFQKHALPDYRKILTEVGLESFKALTYEDYIALLEKYSDEEKVCDWVKYLRARYLGL